LIIVRPLDDTSTDGVSSDPETMIDSGGGRRVKKTRAAQIGIGEHRGPLRAYSAT
jgi:hypothetical protein